MLKVSFNKCLWCKINKNNKKTCSFIQNDNEIIKTIEIFVRTFIIKITAVKKKLHTEILNY